MPGIPNSNEVISHTISSMNCIGACSMNSVSSQASLLSRYFIESRGIVPGKFAQAMHGCHYERQAVAIQVFSPGHLPFYVPQVW